MSSPYTIYQGREAAEASVVQLYQASTSIAVIASRLGVSLLYVRAVLMRRGFLGGINPSNEGRITMLKEMLAQGKDWDEIQRRTGYSHNTIRTYRSWLLPDDFNPRLLPGLKRRAVPEEVRGKSVVKIETWPCNALEKMIWPVCYHTRNCQCWLNGHCEVSDGTGSGS